MILIASYLVSVFIFSWILFVSVFASTSPRSNFFYGEFSQSQSFINVYPKQIDKSLGYAIFKNSKIVLFSVSSISLGIQIYMLLRLLKLNEKQLRRLGMRPWIVLFGPYLWFLVMTYPFLPEGYGSTSYR